MYLSVYNNLCNTRKLLTELYVKGSGLHKHHIKPRHSGGTDDENNFTYFTVKEHIIAHFLLWKLYNNANDLRAMKMLGANLTFKQRQATGIFCRDNKIGFHNTDKFSKEDRNVAAKKGIKVQYDAQIGIHDPSKKKEYCSLGGKAGGKKQAELGLGIHSPEVRAIACSKGGKSHTGKHWIHNPLKNLRTRATTENLQEFLNDGWLRGSGPKNIKGSS